MVKEKTNCLAIIPARGGSKGIQRKNTRKYGVEVIKRSKDSAMNDTSNKPVIKIGHDKKSHLYRFIYNEGLQKWL